MSHGVSHVTALIQSRQIQTDEAGTTERWIHLVFTWSGKPFTLDVAESDRYVLEYAPWDQVRNSDYTCRIYDLKTALRELTNVPEERQKILGLVKGKLPPDQERMYVECVPA
jgi:ubiquitin-like domain-containing CTD phosphatase 1